MVFSTGVAPLLRCCYPYAFAVLLFRFWEGKSEASPSFQEDNESLDYHR